MADRKSWETESGLPDDFEGTIVAAKFDRPASYASGEAEVLVLSLDTALRQLDTFVSIGSGWSIKDDGQRVEHAEGKGFQESSVYGRMINRCAKELGMLDLLQARGEDTNAGVWVGLKFHWKQEKQEFGPTVGEKEHLMPVAFLGEVEITEEQAKGAEPKEETPPAADAAAEKKALLKLKKVAKAADDVGTFQEEAIDVEDLTAELLDRLLDDDAAEELYGELRGE